MCQCDIVGSVLPVLVAVKFEGRSSAATAAWLNVSHSGWKNESTDPASSSVRSKKSSEKSRECFQAMFIFTSVLPSYIYTDPQTLTALQATGKTH